MAGSFAALRAKSGDAIEHLQKMFEKEKSKGRKDPILDDETFYNTTHIRGTDGVGSVTLRFLPAPEDEFDPYVTWEEYQFQGTGGWYINRNRKSLGDRDPAYEYNGTIFGDKSLTKEERKAKLLMLRSFYVGNVLIIKDKNKPENEGKVFKWRWGNQIHNMIQAAISPNAELDAKAEKFDPFDPLDGHNFVLRVTTKKIGGKDVPSYEKSTFESNQGRDKTSVVENPEDFDAIWAQEHKLAPLKDPSMWKSYDELKKEFDRVMGLNQNFLDEDRPEKPTQTKKPASKPEQKAASKPVDDEIPDFEETTDEKATEFQSSDDDDWFNKNFK